MALPLGGFSSTVLVLIEIGRRSVGFCGGRKTGEPGNSCNFAQYLINPMRIKNCRVLQKMDL